MLRIRRAQRDIGEEIVRRSFEGEVLAHLWAYYPGACERLGEEGAREAVRRAIARAEAEGLRKAGELCLHVTRALAGEAGARGPADDAPLCRSEDEITPVVPCAEREDG